MALFPYVQIALPSDFGGQYGTRPVAGFSLLSPINRAGQFTTFAAAADVAIHPGTSMYIVAGEVRAHDTDQRIHYKVAADSMALRESVLVIPRVEPISI